MNVYEELEAAGHTLTMVAPLLGGVTTYYCEGCGALVRIRDGVVQLFHVPPGSWARRDGCKPPGNARTVDGPEPTLKAKLDALVEEDLHRLRARDYDEALANAADVVFSVKPR